MTELSISELVRQLGTRLKTAHTGLPLARVIEQTVLPDLLGPPPPWALGYRITDGTTAGVSAFIFVLFYDHKDKEIKVILQEKADGTVAASGGGFYNRKIKEQPRENALRENGEEICGPQLDAEGKPIPIAAPHPDTVSQIPLPEGVDYGRTLRDPMAPPVAYSGFYGWLDDQQAATMQTHIARMATDEAYKKDCLKNANNELVGVKIYALAEAAALPNFKHRQEKQGIQWLQTELSANRMAWQQPPLAPARAASP